MPLHGEQIAVYLAGYLAQKAKSKFSCESCTSLWVATEKERELSHAQYVFFQHAQYDTNKVSMGYGLTAPNSALLNVTKDLEQTFRCVFPCIVHSNHLLSKLILSTSNKILTRGALEQM